MTTDTCPRPLPVKGYLVNHRVTVTDLARRVGVAREHLGRVLNRQEPLSRNLAMAVAGELGLDLDQAHLLLGDPAGWRSGRRGGRRPAVS